MATNAQCQSQNNPEGWGGEVGICAEGKSLASSTSSAKWQCKATSPRLIRFPLAWDVTPPRFYC